MAQTQVEQLDRIVPEPPEHGDRHVLHEPLRHRRSPRAFAPRLIEPALLRKMLGAARWAPSAGNGQPWSFILATRDDEEAFAQLLSVLSEKNQRWAVSAAALLIAVTATVRPDGKEHGLALYDLGLAVENMVIEGMANGVFAHQMSGFDVEAARRVFAIPAGKQPAVAIALGYLGDPADLPDDLRERETAPRARKPLAEFVFRGRFGHPAPVVEGATGA